MSAKKPQTKTAAPKPPKATEKKKVAQKPSSAKAPASEKPSKPKGKKADEEIRLEDPDNSPPVVFRPRHKPQEQNKTVLNMVKNVRKSVEVLSDRSKKKPVKLFTPAMLRNSMTNHHSLYFQNMLGATGFRYPSVIEVVAAESIGSTTFVFDWIGNLIGDGCYVTYCECEGKQMKTSQIKRILDRDPVAALTKLNAIAFTSARSLAQLDEVIRQSVAEMRKRCDSDPYTKGNPVYVFVDPRSALMSQGEAKGNSDWGVDEKQKESPKETDAGSNFEHAKHDQAMARWLPAFTEKYNCVIVLVSKQNDKVDMEKRKGPASFAAPSPTKNDTRLGGRAFKRLSAYRITMLKMQDIREKKGDKREIGHVVRFTLIKNSYGPRSRICEATVYHEGYEDREDYQAPAITFDERTAAWMANNKFLGVTVEKDLYTCDAVGCVAVPPAELMKAFYASKTNVDYLGGCLSIEGYQAPKQSIAKAAAPAAATKPEEEEAPSIVP